MMRYVLYDTDSDRTTLDKEIQFVGNYIELMRIRYVDDVDIRFEHPSATVARGVVVPPLLLIVFVENAFKHGVSYDAPSFIHIDISLAGGRAALPCGQQPPQEAGEARRRGAGKRAQASFAALRQASYACDRYLARDVYEINLSIPVKNHG